MPRKVTHLHTEEIWKKISVAMMGNKNGAKGKGIKKPGSRASGVKNLVEKGVPARMASPLGGPFETCAFARPYDLISPDGVRYQGRNLKLFVREHPELFLPDDIAPESSGEYPRTRAGRKLGQLMLEPHRLSWKGWTKPEKS